MTKNIAVNDERGTTSKLRAYEWNDFMSLEIPRRKRIVGRWLLSASAVLIHAKRGLGKSQLVLWLGYSIAGGKDVLGWKVKRPRRVIYLDGEMHPDELKVRIRRLRRALGPIPAKGRFAVVSALLEPEQAPDLSTEEGQDKLTNIVADFDVVILDNLSAWDGSGREDAEAWRKIQPWVWRLQKTGKALILVHHSGKSGKQRGSSRKEDSLDVVIRLDKPGKAMNGQSTGAFFDLHFEKTRHFASQEHGRQLLYRKDASGKYGWDMSVVETIGGWQAKAKRLQSRGLSITEIARRVGKHKATISRFLRG